MSDLKHSWQRMAIRVTAISALLSCCQSIAAELAMTFEGHLVNIVQCTVNHGNPIEVSFGNINATTASGHIAPLTYSLACVGNGPGNTVTLRLDTAHHGTHDPKAMGTTLPGLEIVLLKDGHRQDIGEAFAVDLNTPPVLELQLEIMPGVTPSLNDFDATGTLTAEYQ